jgi:MFS family permease
MSATPPQDWPPEWVKKAVLLLASMLPVAATATLAPATPAIQAAFADAPNANTLARLVVTLPALFIVLGAPVVGWLIDRYGRRRLLLTALIAYGIVGVCGGLAPSLPALLVTRALMGLTVAGILTAVTTLIADYYHGTTRAQLLGLQAAFMGFGGSSFVLLGGLLADVGWRAPFAVYGLALLLVPLAVRVLSEPPKHAAPHNASSVDGLSPDGGPLQLPVARVVLIYSVIFVLQVTYFTIAVQLPFYLPKIVGAADNIATQSGFAVACLSLTYATVALQAKRVQQRLNYGGVVVLGFTCIGSGLILIGAAQTWPALLCGLVVTGLGTGSTQPNMSVWLASITPPAVRGRVVGGFSTAISLGQFLSGFINQPVIDRVGRDGMWTAFGGVALALAVCGLLVLAQRTTDGDATRA